MTLSAVIPTLNAARVLAPTLSAMGAADEIVVADGGSSDGTLDIARRLAATALTAPRGRGVQLAAGAQAARGDWLLFLHADTVLAAGWRKEAQTFMTDASNAERAGVFRFALDDQAPEARRLEKAVAWRTRVLGLPYGDQGLLMARPFYEGLGGFRPLPLMEDVDLVRRIGRSRIVPLATEAVTSAERWRRDGWHRRSARNLACLSLYFAGVPPRLIQRLYG
ncbi:MAG: TIGR04283 family arsenosugar biosynthesis glycosyltransferase [Magnetospirillum sp.]|nr:TIGR04283 family arsenosugar biosynthesis glycosyltransferase [Magnetospirillum sp.]